MKRLSLAIAAALLAASSAPCFADQPGPDWIPAERVIQKLTEKGYTNISKVEADDGRWEAKAVLNGARQKVYLDPRTGEVVGHKPTR